MQELLTAVCLTCELLFSGYPPNMSIVNQNSMAEQLILHEGLKLTPYRDTVKKITIGVGYNVSDRGWAPLEEVIGRKINKKKPSISRAEALLMLFADIERFEAVLAEQWPFYLGLDEVRQRVMLDLAFNMAYRLREFVNTRAFLEARNFEKAADNLMLSKWARQVKTRATRLTTMLRTGLDYSK